MDISKLLSLPLSPFARRILPAAAAGTSILIAAAITRWWLNRDGPSLIAPSLATIFNNGVNVRRMTPSDAPAAGKTLAAAFTDDPLICAMTDLQQPARAMASRRLYEALIRAATPASRDLVVIGSNSLDAVALWMPPCEYLMKQRGRARERQTTRW